MRHCRFTWDVIKKHRRHTAIVLTTHSMEEADVLCDRIAIMVEGRLATVGTSLDLKSQFGVGYTLTVVKARQVQNQDGRHDVPRWILCTVLATTRSCSSAGQICGVCLLTCSCHDMHWTVLRPEVNVREAVI